MQDKYVTVNFERIGMGNVMFKLASAIGISKKRNAICCLNEDSEHLSGFCGPFPPLMKNIIFDRYIHEKNEGIFTPNMNNDFINENIRVGRYLQSYKYFSHCQEEIKNIFQPKNIYKEEASNWFTNNGISRDDIKVCIHFRRGDMVYEAQHFPSNEWFSMIIKHYIPDNAKIIVFSDDIEWAKKQDYLSKSVCFFSENNSKMLDFTLMTLCDYFILSRGTFAWWAVYLSKKKKVFYSNEFSDTIYNDNFDDYYIDDWTHIKDNMRDLKIRCRNESNITIKDNFDLINYYSYGNVNVNIEKSYGIFRQF